MLQPTLELLAKDRMEQNRIEILWRGQFVDRQVGAALEQLFSPDSDMLLVNYVPGKAKNLSTEEIRASLVRCQVTLGFPVQHEAEQPARTGRAPRRKSKNEAGPAAPSSGVSLQDIIRAGILPVPARFSGCTKGASLVGRVEKDGRVTFGGERSRLDQ